MDSAQDYRPAQQKLGRRLFLSFELVNALSFTLLTGNLIVLLLLRFGADPFTIGIIQAFSYVSFLFMPLSKRIVPKAGLINTFGWSWTLRYIAIIPLVFAPILVGSGNSVLGIVLVVVGYSLFQILRGFGLIANSPLTQALSAGKDRGAYLSQKNLMINIAALLAGLLVSLGLGSYAPLERYSLFLGIGVALGFVGCIIIFKIPEPPSARFGASSPFFADVRVAMKDPSFARFVVPFSLFMFVGGMGRSFMIVYAKNAYGFGDDAAMILTVVAGLGAVVMSLFSRVVLDRVGPKPMFILFTLAFLLSILPLGLFLPLPGIMGWLLLIAVFFFGSLGGAGGENAAQAYFLNIVGKERQFNVGMLYFLILGFAGAIGSVLGGSLLVNIPLLTGLGTGNVFRIFFGLVFVLGIVSLLFQFRMDRRGGHSVSSAFSAVLSARGLREMSLLQRLDQSTSVEQEEQTLIELVGSSTGVAVEDLLKRLDSPIFAIRNRALFALEELTYYRPVEDALIRHVKEYKFATAYRAVRILGRKNCKRSTTAIRCTLNSDDYLLQAYSASALADLGDVESRGALEAVLAKTNNTLVMVHCIGALKSFGCIESMVSLLQVLARPTVSPHMRDEVVFGIAGILGMENWLYAKYLAFIEDSQTGVALLLDEIDAAGFSIADVEMALHTGGLDAEMGRFLVRVHRMVRDTDGDTLLATSPFVAELPVVLAGLDQQELLIPGVAANFLNAWNAGDIDQYIRLRFFLSALVVYSLCSRRSSTSDDTGTVIRQ